MSSSAKGEQLEAFREIDGLGIDTLSIQLTPLESILGIENAENIYDLLPLRDQLILDLKAAGWSQHDIAQALGISQGWVSILIQRIRYTLANSSLMHTMEIRKHYRENSPIIRQTTPFETFEESAA